MADDSWEAKFERLRQYSEQDRQRRREEIEKMSSDVQYRLSEEHKVLSEPTPAYEGQLSQLAIDQAKRLLQSCDWKVDSDGDESLEVSNMPYETWLAINRIIAAEQLARGGRIEDVDISMIGTDKNSKIWIKGDAMKIRHDKTFQEEIKTPEGRIGACEISGLSKTEAIVASSTPVYPIQSNLASPYKVRG